MSCLTDSIPFIALVSGGVASVFIAQIWTAFKMRKEKQIDKFHMTKII